MLRHILCHPYTDSWYNIAMFMLIHLIQIGFSWLLKRYLLNERHHKDSIQDNNTDHVDGGEGDGGNDDDVDMMVVVVMVYSNNDEKDYGRDGDDDKDGNGDVMITMMKPIIY